MAPHSYAVPIPIRPRHVGRLPRCSHRMEHVRVHAVEQEPDDVARTTGGRVEHVGAHLAVLPREVVTAVVGRATEQLGDRGRDVDEATGARHQTVVAHALARDHDQHARLHDAERTVLTAVASLVLPVVRGGVEHAQVGRSRVVEELRDVVERVRVRVRRTRWVRVARSASRPTSTSADCSASGSAPRTSVRT